MSSDDSKSSSVSVSVKLFRHVPTATACFVVTDPATKATAIIDSVTDYTASSGEYHYEHADSVLAYVAEQKLDVKYILETHVHADHLTGARYLKEKLDNKPIIGIGEHISAVQKTFGPLFNISADEMPYDGSQFDHLFKDNEQVPLGDGDCTIKIMSTPGHTPACICYLIGDAVFTGDTLFHPDIGTARCDFPGGSAETMWASTQRILALPDDTRMFIGHDYPGDRREYTPQLTVKQQKEQNKMVKSGTTRDEYIAARKARDDTLGAPGLLLPSLQVNMRAGCLPPPEDNGTSYVKIPLRQKQ
jgi:glyoxylase-like metal-dependent hydrolase (beta-lactamase superfamily II)